MAEEEATRSAEQQRRDEELAGRFTGIIKRQVESNFNKQGLQAGLKAVIKVRLAPNGDVLDVSIVNSSGNSLFDQRALLAVEKSSPLRVPDDPEVFERLGFRQFNFVFEPQD